MRLLRPTRLAAASLFVLCACSNGHGFFPLPDASLDAQLGDTAARDTSAPPDTAPMDVVVRDVQPVDVPFMANDVVIAPDSACASASSPVSVTRLPVDIIWVVDNSGSMSNTITEVRSGLNYFACRVASGPAIAGMPDPCAPGGTGPVGDPVLDYRVIMLSLRGTTGQGICIPPPLSGDSSCGNGPRFHHASINIRSTQTLEQFLGTLGVPDTFMETSNYLPNQTRGEMRDATLPSWGTFLRPGATRSIVLATDDNSRLTATQFEHFAGGSYTGSASSPTGAGTVLPPGILEAGWHGMFDGYTFNAIFNYGDTPGSVCQTSGNYGSVYDTLITGSHGARARICDGHAAWTPFLDAVATAVERTSRVACDLAVPPAPMGTELDPGYVNVALQGTSRVLLGRVQSMATCNATSGGWYFDNNDTPTRVFLCPASCDTAQTTLRTDGARIEVLFGCSSIPG